MNVIVDMSDWPYWLRVAAQFQTAIGAIVGFTGVMITLFVNGWLNRRTRKRDIDHEREVLRISCVSELSFIHNTLLGMIEQISHRAPGALLGDGDWFTDMDAATDLLRHHLPRIGLLTSEEVFHLWYVYVMVRSMNSDSKRLYVENSLELLVDLERLVRTAHGYVNGRLPHNRRVNLEDQASSVNSTTGEAD